VTQATFQLFARPYGAGKVEPEIWAMRHPLTFRSRLNWRLIALLTVLLALCLAGAIYGGGDTRTATAALGPGWSCTPNILGTVCVRDVTKDVTRTAAKR
jgi:hypothetical protein